jgi:hypothetical protein
MVQPERRAGVASGGECADLDLGMRAQQPKQLTPRISAGPGHRHLHTHMNEYVITWMSIQDRHPSADINYPL